VRIESPDPSPRDSGDYETWIAKSYGDPRGTITLDEKGDLVMRAVRIDDCDRLIKAACEIKRKLTAYRAEMAAPHGRAHLHKGTCQLCGKPEDDELHADPPEPGTVVDAEIIDDDEAGPTFGAAELRRADAYRDPRAGEELCRAMHPDRRTPFVCTLWQHSTPKHQAYDSHGELCIEWTDGAPEMCDATMPLPHGGELKCTFDEGHFGAHSAIGGKRRWIGTGDNAHTEEGEPIADADPEPPAFVTEISGVPVSDAFKMVAS